MWLTALLNSTMTKKPVKIPTLQLPGSTPKHTHTLPFTKYTALTMESQKILHNTPFCPISWHEMSSQPSLSLLWSLPHEPDNKTMIITTAIIKRSKLDTAENVVDSVSCPLEEMQKKVLMWLSMSEISPMPAKACCPGKILYKFHQHDELLKGQWCTFLSVSGHESTKIQKDRLFGTFIWLEYSSGGLVSHCFYGAADKPAIFSSKNSSLGSAQKDVCVDQCIQTAEAPFWLK